MLLDRMAVATRTLLEFHISRVMGLGCLRLRNQGILRSSLTLRLCQLKLGDCLKVKDKNDFPSIYKNSTHVEDCKKIVWA